MPGETVVLVHGGWGSPEDWEEIIELLRSRGMPSLAVDLPSCRNGVYGDLHADAAAVRDALDSCEGPTIACGYSYGGFPMTEGAAGHPRVARLVYLAALMPEETETVLDLLSRAASGRSDVSPPLLFDDGTSLPDLSNFERELAHHSREVIKRMLTMQRRRQAVASAIQQPSSVAWRTIPSTYVLTKQDRNLPQELQRQMASRASEVVEIDFDHFVPFSHPEVVVDILVHAAQSEAVRSV